MTTWKKSTKTEDEKPDDSKKDITFTISAAEYSEANVMAKSKHFNSIEDLVTKKYQHVLKVYRLEQNINTKEN